MSTHQFNTYCPQCDKSVAANLDHVVEKITVRGLEVEYTAKHAVCPNCGCIIGDSRVEKENLDNAFDVYREAKGYMSIDQLKSLRNSYGLSLREFSKFLGFGEQTYARYERGSLPDEAHYAVIAQAATVEGAGSLLDLHGNHLSKAAVDKVNAYIARGICADKTVDSKLETMIGSFGYVKFDRARIEQVVFYLSTRIRDFYWTKLQKTLFFVDALSYERRAVGVTGLTYSHAPYGPIVHSDGELYALVSHNEFVCLVEKSFGQVIEPLKKPASVLSREDAEILDDVALFINTFKNTTAVSNFSHTLSGWKNTQDGQTIDYTLSSKEIASAIERRLHK